MFSKQMEQRHTRNGLQRNFVDASTQTEAELPPTQPLPPQVEVLRASTSKACRLITPLTCVTEKGPYSAKRLRGPLPMR